MKPYFPRDPAAAVRLQRELAALVRLAGPPRRLKYVAGVDVAYDKARNLNVGAAVVLTYPDLEVIEVVTGTEATAFPYIPGLLSFREAPLCYRLLGPLRGKIDVLVVDGQGIAHPRRFGLASHLGVLLDIPAVGCAKSILVGEGPAKLGARRGARGPLVDRGERVGTVLRTRKGVKPVYVSVGYRCRLGWAEDLILALAPRYRLAEPIRLAHQEVTHLRESLSG